MKTTALTAYGLVGTSWIRLTACILETGYALRRADGTNTVIDVLPERWRTCGDITNAAAKLGHKVNVGSVPSVGLSNHKWKTEYDLFGIALRKAGSKAAATPIVVGLLATYADELEAAA